MLIEMSNDHIIFIISFIFLLIVAAADILEGTVTLEDQIKWIHDIELSILKMRNVPKLG